jgi:hypothetical protein
VRRFNKRFDNYKTKPLQFTFPAHFTGKSPSLTEMFDQAAIIREKEVTQNVKWLMLCI